TLVLEILVCWYTSSSVIGPPVCSSNSRTSRAFERIGIRYSRFSFGLANLPFLRALVAASLLGLISILSVRSDRCHLPAAFRADALHVPALRQRRQRILGESPHLPPLSQQRPHVVPECATEQLFGCHQFALILQPLQLLMIHKRSFQPQFLSCDHGLHHGFHFAFQVV